MNWFKKTPPPCLEGYTEHLFLDSPEDFKIISDNYQKNVVDFKNFTDQTKYNNIFLKNNEKILSLKNFNIFNMSPELKQGDTCIQILNISHAGNYGTFDYTDAKDKKVYNFESLLAFSTQKTINLYTLYYKLKEEQQIGVDPILTQSAGRKSRRIKRTKKSRRSKRSKRR